jgi:hypothetical protein
MQKLIQIQNAIKAARGNGKYKVDNDVLFAAIDEALDRIEELEEHIDCLETCSDECSVCRYDENNNICDDDKEENDGSKFIYENDTVFKYDAECDCDRCKAIREKQAE